MRFSLLFIFFAFFQLQGMHESLYKTEAIHNQPMTEEPFITIKTSDNKELSYRKSTVERTTIFATLLKRSQKTNILDLSQSINSTILKSFFDCMQDPDIIAKIDNAELLSLFLAADCYGLPKHIIEKIAHQIHSKKLHEKTDNNTKTLLRRYYRTLQTLVDLDIKPRLEIPNSSDLKRNKLVLTLRNQQLKSLEGLSNFAKTISEEDKEKISSIDLSFNELETIDIPIKTFQKIFRNLRNIDLSNNKIQDISGEILDTPIGIDFSNTYINSWTFKTLKVNKIYQLKIARLISGGLSCFNLALLLSLPLYASNGTLREKVIEGLGSIFFTYNTFSYFACNDQLKMIKKLKSSDFVFFNSESPSIYLLAENSRALKKERFSTKTNGLKDLKNIAGSNLLPDLKNIVTRYSHE